MATACVDLPQIVRRARRENQDMATGRSMTRVLFLVAILGAGCAEAPPTSEQMAKDIMSPFCPGRTLATCPSLAADDLQAEIATRLKAGDTREQIMKDLEAKYGTVVLGAPPAEGVGLLLRTVPFLVGLGIVWLLSRLASVRRDVAETVPPADSRLTAQLDDDLADLD